jgi:type II secretory pathway component GspD/PulD (secretin)
VISLLKELQELRREVAGQSKVTVVHLKHLVADDAARILTVIIGPNREAVKVEADVRLNSVTIRADAAQAAQLKEILSRIDVPVAQLPQIKLPSLIDVQGK